MRGENQRLHQEGNGSRTASHAVHTPPIVSFFSLFSCPDKISQQSHELVVGNQASMLGRQGQEAPRSSRAGMLKAQAHHLAAA